MALIGMTFIGMAYISQVVALLDAKLRAVIDYPARDVAQYNRLSFDAWTRRTSDWRDVCAPASPTASSDAWGTCMPVARWAAPRREPSTG